MSARGATSTATSGQLITRAGRQILTQSILAIFSVQVPYTSKPWAYLCQHPWRSTFFAVLDTTPWRGWRPQQCQVAVACADEVERLLARVAAEHVDFDADQRRQAILQHVMQH